MYEIVEEIIQYNEGKEPIQLRMHRPQIRYSELPEEFQTKISPEEYFAVQRTYTAAWPEISSLMRTKEPQCPAHDAPAKVRKELSVAEAIEMLGPWEVFSLSFHVYSYE